MSAPPRDKTILVDADGKHHSSIGFCLTCFPGDGRLRLLAGISNPLGNHFQKADMNERSTRQKARNMQSNNELEGLFSIRAMHNFRARLYRHERGPLRAGEANMEAVDSGSEKYYGGEWGKPRLSDQRLQRYSHV
jgi:hypothetical protein